MRHVGTAKDFLAGLEDGSAACCITDPPWDLAGGGLFVAVADYARMTIADCLDTLADLRRVLMPGGFLYTFAPAGPELQEVIVGMAERGWTFQRELSWVKGGAGLGHWKGAHEPVLIYTNGPSRGYLESGRYKSVLEYDRPAGRTAKPWQVYRAFVEMSSKAGELVVDPFCGTNPLKAACASLQPSRRWQANDVLTETQVLEAVNTSWPLSRKNVRPVPGQSSLGVAA